MIFLLYLDHFLISYHRTIGELTKNLDLIQARKNC